MQDLVTFLSNHSILTGAASIIMTLLVLVEYLRAKRNSFCIDTTQAVQLMNHKHAVVADIRANDLYKKGHIIDSMSISGQDIAQHPKKIEKLKNKPIIVVCNGGIESQKIAAKLIKQGYNAYSLSGGMRAWVDASMPVIKE